MKIAKKTLLMAAITLSLQGCLGDASKDNDLIGQVKKVKSMTPFLCPDFKAVDISLGVIRNGVGSMSTQDIWLYVPNDADYAVLTKAAETGAIVKVKYDEARLRFCVPEEMITHAEITN